jgi:hypothetical protein
MKTSRGLVVACLILAQVSGVGCSSNFSDKSGGVSQAEKTKQAILLILREDERIAKATKDSVSKDASPSHVASQIGAYYSRTEALDLSNCPADFRVAYRQHIRAWREAQAAVAELPDDFVEGAFMGFFNGLLRGELDGGAGRLQGDLKKAVDKVNSTWDEVEKIGAKYDAAL